MKKRMFDHPSFPSAKVRTAHIYRNAQCSHGPGRIHRDTVPSGLSLDTFVISRSLCLFIARVTLYSSVGKSSVGDLELQNFSAWGGCYEK